jgi:hypothetical protein
MKKMINRISEFFKTLWVILKDDMDKNVQTYKEEREQQKKVKNGLK